MSATGMRQPSQISIRRWAEIGQPDRLTPELDAIFFEASPTKTFASETERQAFRERWLGRYLTHDPQWTYLAIDTGASDAGVLAGYLVGRVDPGAGSALENDAGPFPETARLTAAYPAHLHVNLAPQYRNHGIGADLIGAFAADAARAGACGVHVVTGAASRNLGFYQRNGFHGLARASVGGREIVFLGRRLDAPETA
jgi:GNAT superfamily N-acetyltransferase